MSIAVAWAARDFFIPRPKLNRHTRCTFILEALYSMVSKRLFEIMDTNHNGWYIAYYLLRWLKKSSFMIRYMELSKFRMMALLRKWCEIICTITEFIKIILTYYRNVYLYFYLCCINNIGSHKTQNRSTFHRPSIYDFAMRLFSW